MSYAILLAALFMYLLVDSTFWGVQNPFHAIHNSVFPVW